MKETFRRIVQTWLIVPFTQFLKTGLSPNKLAQSFSIGICFGIMPLPGSTLTCTIAAVALKLNFGAIQLINYMVAPLQLILIYPFLKASAYITGIDIIAGSGSALIERLKLDTLNVLSEVGITIGVAFILWLLISIPLGIVLFKVSLPVFNRISVKRAIPNEE
ncbi:MAG: DUF2062 domain-containing protein [Lentimicrobium sp.]|nr:DUF2062 domain-containing protein [Lentimicrobium sp.]